MNVGQLLQAQYAQSHQLLMGVVGDLEGSFANDAKGLGTVGSVGSIYAHIAFTEDLFVANFKGVAPLYTAGKWDEKLKIAMPGIQQTAEWAAVTKVPFPAFHEFAKAVFANTEAYMAGLTEGDLEREVPGVGGRMVPLSALAGNVGIIHVNSHMGEIAAIKGFRGLKGLPF